MTSYFQDGGDG